MAAAVTTTRAEVQNVRVDSSQLRAPLVFRDETLVFDCRFSETSSAGWIAAGVLRRGRVIDEA
jgi:hypothetical protein